MKPRVILSLVLAAIAAAAAGYGVHKGIQNAGQNNGGASDSPAALPKDMVLQDLEGQRHHFSDWHGKLLLVNFWASWCAPCIDEIPELIKDQQRYGGSGLQIVGAAVDDADSARKIQHKMGMNYPVLIGTPEQLLGLMNQLGNQAGGLPFSVLVDAKGQVVARELGQYAPDELAALIETHLPK
jgi:thiol-disulfide isomerase/thioredoxin